MAESKNRLNKIINSFLEEIQKKYKIENAYLYGSYAKGTFNKWSDIDIAIVSPDFPDDLFETRLSLMRLASTIDVRIEPKLFKKEFFNRNDPLVDEIQKNGVRII